MIKEGVHGAKKRSKEIEYKYEPDGGAGCSSGASGVRGVGAMNGRGLGCRIVGETGKVPNWMKC